MRRLIKLGVAVAAVVVSTAGCSTVNPDTSQVALHYSGGSLFSQNFENCVSPGQREFHMAGHTYFYYPHGQRTFESRTGPDGNIAPGAEERDVAIGTKGINGQPGPQVYVPVAVTFQLVEDCTPYTDARGQHWPGGHLQKFNDTIGRQSKIYVEDPDTEPDFNAWSTFLNNYIGGPTGKAMNAEGLNYTMAGLYSDAGERNDFINKIEHGPNNTPGPLQQLIDQQMGDHFVDVLNVQVGQPSPPRAWLDQLTAQQVTQQQAANAQTTASVAQNWPGGVNGYLDYQQRKAQIDQQSAINEAIKSGRVTAIPVPYGSPVIVGGH